MKWSNKGGGGRKTWGKRREAGIMQQELGRKDVITWTKRGNNLKRRGN